MSISAPWHLNNGHPFTGICGQDGSSVPLEMLKKVDCPRCLELVSWWPTHGFSVPEPFLLEILADSSSTFFSHTTPGGNRLVARRVSIPDSDGRTRIDFTLNPGD